MQELEKTKLSNLKLDKALALTETNSSTDIAMLPGMIKPLLYKVYTESLVSEIADVQPINSPIALIYTLFSSHGGSSGDLTTFNSTILTLESNTLIVGDAVVTATGNGTVEYSEGDKVLVRINSGHFVIAQTINSTAIKIIDVISNRNYIRKVFKHYIGPYTTADGERLSNVPEINHQLIRKTVETKTRKIKSKVTSEAMEDLENTYGVPVAEEILKNEFASEMIQSIDMEVIDYLKSIASPISDVILANSYGVTGGDLSSIATDLYLNIYKLTIDIMRNTKRRKNFFVLADSATMGLMMSSPLHVKPEESQTNSYFMGKIGKSYDLYLDPYSTDNYVLVGYKSKSSELGDAGLIYCPYTTSFQEAVETETGKSVFFHNLRYAYMTHPQDITTGNSDSIFFKMFNVNLTGLINYSNIDNEKV